MSERRVHIEPIPKDQLPKSLMQIAQSLGLEGEDAEAYVRALQSGQGVLLSSVVKEEGKARSEIETTYDPSTGIFSSPKG